MARDLRYAYGCAVGNAMAARDSDLFTMPRLTIRQSTAMARFQEVVQGRHVPRIYLKERALTKGWAVAGPRWAAFRAANSGPPAAPARQRYAHSASPTAPARQRQPLTL